MIALATSVQSAIRNPQSAIVAASPPQGWLTTDRAARILGIQNRAVQLRCARGDLKALRFQVGDSERWFINPASDERFALSMGGAPEPRPHLAGEGLADLSEAKRERLYRDHKFVESYLAAEEARPEGCGKCEFRARYVAAWNAVHPAAKKSVGTARRMIDRYRILGIAGLVDARYGPMTDTFTPDAMDCAVGLYLRQEKPALATIHKQVLALAPSLSWQVPVYRQFCRRVRRHLSRRLELFGRNPRLYQKRCELLVRRDWSKVAAMELWVADHRQLDIWIPAQNAEGKWHWARPWITAFIDARSWYPVAWSIYLGDPNSDIILGTFIRGVREHGQPEWIYLDNGKDFRAQKIAGGREGVISEKGVEPVLAALDIQVVWALPYNARAKVIENWFGRAMAPHFDKNWATYCGRDPGQRPETTEALDPAQAAAEGLTLEVVKQAFSDWITHNYAVMECPVSASKGRSTLRAFRELRAPDFTPSMPAEETLALLLLPSKPLTVGQRGIEMKQFGQSYWAPELADLSCASQRDEARKVMIRFDPGDDSHIYVFTRAGRFLCIATPYVGSGVHPLVRAGTEADQEQLARAMQLKGAMKKADAETVRGYRQAAARFAPRLLHEIAANAILGLHDLAPVADAPMPTIRLMPGHDLAAAAGREYAAAEARKLRIAGLATGTESRIPNPESRIPNPESRCFPGGGIRAASEPSVLDLLPVDEPAAQERESDHDHADRGDESA